MTTQSGFRLATCSLLALAWTHAAVVIDARKVPAPPQELPFNAGGWERGERVAHIGRRTLIAGCGYTEGGWSGVSTRDIRNATWAENARSAELTTCSGRNLKSAIPQHGTCSRLLH
jgi:hypothetical protein